MDPTSLSFNERTKRNSLIRQASSNDGLPNDTSAELSQVTLPEPSELIKDTDFFPFSETSQIGPEFICKELLNESKQLLYENEFEKSFLWLKHAMIIAVKYEFYEEQLGIIQQYKGNYIFYGKRMSLFDLDTEEISTVTKLQKDADALLREINIYQYSSDKTIQSKIISWKKRSHKISSHQIAKKYKRLKISMILLQVRPTLIGNTISSCLNRELEILAHDEIVQYNKNLLPEITCLLAYNALLAGNQKSAKKYFDSLYPTQISRFLYSNIFLLEMSFTLALFFNDLNKCLLIIGVVNGLPILRKNIYLNFRWNYLIVGMRMKSGQYTDAWKLIMTTPLCNKDRTSFELYFSVLSIICLVESGSDELLQDRADSDAKFFRRNLTKSTKSDHRLGLIFAFMKILCGNKFNFTKTMKKADKIVLMLKNGEGKYKWNPCGYETIRFDKWIERHIMITMSAAKF